MEQMKVKELYNLNETIAATLFDEDCYPWELLPKIADFIVELGNTLSEDKFEKRGDNIWIAKSATVAPTACLNGPLIIDEDAEIRHCAFIRGNAIVGKGAVVGNSTELKNVVLFNKVQVPHYNYVGDSILGFKAHMGGIKPPSFVLIYSISLRILYNVSLLIEILIVVLFLMQHQLR